MKSFGLSQSSSMRSSDAQSPQLQSPTVQAPRMRTSNAQSCGMHFPNNVQPEMSTLPVSTSERPLAPCRPRRSSSKEELTRSKDPTTPPITPRTPRYETRPLGREKPTAKEEPGTSTDSGAASTISKDGPAPKKSRPLSFTRVEENGIVIAALSKAYMHSHDPSNEDKGSNPDENHNHAAANAHVAGGNNDGNGNQPRRPSGPSGVNPARHGSHKWRYHANSKGQNFICTCPVHSDIVSTAATWPGPSHFCLRCSLRVCTACREHIDCAIQKRDHELNCPNQRAIAVVRWAVRARERRLRKVEARRDSRAGQKG
ncbi:hypothetical protein LTR86_002674 [Recurvomyces mirabilis]|nr:hypothetical protein LTR86_002674 [Recurvomyces mirabilis]